MTNEQILKKAIEKAVEGGWDKELIKGKRFLSEVIKENACDYGFYIEVLLEEDFKYFKITFSLDFAKAFWGEKIMGQAGPPYWSYHLQQMVLEPEPLKYLEKFL